MKNCQGCKREIDKYAIACQYCGRLTKREGKTKNEGDSKTSPKIRTNKNY